MDTQVIDLERVKNRDGNWRKYVLVDTETGTKYLASAKVYNQPSEDYGITRFGLDGHISKITVCEDAVSYDYSKMIVAYDRGWSLGEDGVYGDLTDFGLAEMLGLIEKDIKENPVEL